MLSIKGIKTSLIEVSESDAADIVSLRNDERYNKFLFQDKLTVEGQVKWIQKIKNNPGEKNFKVVNNNNEFKGTISIYGIVNGTGEFGRYIVTNPINAIEAEYLLLKWCFEQLGVKSVYCQTNTDNSAVWNQHTKLGFRNMGTKEVAVGSGAGVIVKAVVQEITSDEFKLFDYQKIIKLISHF